MILNDMLPSGGFFYIQIKSIQVIHQQVQFNFF